MRRRRSCCRFGLIAGLLAVAAGCARAPDGDAGTTAAAVTQEAPELPAPAFGRPDTARRSVVLEYAGGARFVDDPRFNDEQGLLDSGRRGPVVRVEAVVNAHRFRREQLREGRLLARFISAGDYAPLGLRRGEYYVFVDSLDGWRAVIVPRDGGQPTRVMQMAVLSRSHMFDVPSSRWFESEGFTFSYVPCGSGCCIVCQTAIGYTCPTVQFPPLDIGSPAPPPP